MIASFLLAVSSIYIHTDENNPTPTLEPSPLQVEQADISPSLNPPPVQVEQPNTSACANVNPCQKPRCCVDGYIEFKAGYFFPINHRYKKIFSGSGIYGLEGDITIFRPIYLYAGVDFYTERSHVRGNPQFSCSIDLVRPFVGLKLIGLSQWWFRPYLGIAFQEAYVKNKNHAPFMISEQHHWQPGALGQWGILFVKNYFVLDVFANYSWLVINMHSSAAKPVIVHRQNISGFTVGGGLGFYF